MGTVQVFFLAVSLLSYSVLSYKHNLVDGDHKHRRDLIQDDQPINSTTTTSPINSTTTNPINSTTTTNPINSTTTTNPINSTTTTNPINSTTTTNPINSTTTNSSAPKDCPQLEAIARDITWKRVAADPTLPPKLLRLHFHDCIVKGCDASILLDSTSTNKAEKDAIPNLSISGYNVIDEIKGAVEKACPGTVSCADILALAARDAVSFQFKKPMWAVPLGRKDSRVSKASDALTNLPSPDANFTQLLQQFNDRGLDLEDLVALSGAHTIGVSRCGAVIKRLYNFTGAGDTDPAMAPKYAEGLKARCGKFQPNLTVELDPGSSYKFDAHYYRALIENQGLLPSDVTLMSDPRSAEISRNFAGDEQLFFDKFGRSMVKLGALGKGVHGGEIRKNCRLVN